VIWVVGKEDAPKHMVMMIRPPRKKNFRLICFCKRRRKDGTCLLTDGIRPIIYASVRPRVRLEHPGIDERLDRIPDPDPRAFKLTPEAESEVMSS
jgi:hypothetical protein